MKQREFDRFSRQPFLGMHHFSDMVKVENKNKTIRLAETVTGRLPVALVAVCLAAFVGFVFFVEGWDSFSRRIAPPIAALCIGFALFAMFVSFAVGFRRRVVLIDKAFNTLMVLNGRFFENRKKKSLSGLKSVDIDEVTVFRGASSPKRVSILRIEWIDGEKIALLRSSNRQKVEAIKSLIIDR